MRILSPGTNTEVSSIRVGDAVKIVITAKDLNLLANKSVAYTYVLSVAPKGISQPITLSGRITTKLSLLPENGGAAKTAEGMAGLAGTQTTEGTITIPDSMPEGVASLAIVVSSKSGNIIIKKNIKITL